MLVPRTRLVAGVALTSVLVACGADDTRARDVSTESATTSPSSVEGAPTVEMIDAGEEPREEIRLHLEEGDMAHATMTMSTSLTQTVDGRKSPRADTPPIILGMLIETDDVQDDIITSTFSYDSVAVKARGAQADELEESLEPLVGVSGTLKTTSTGAVIEGSIDVPDDAPASLSSTFASFESQMQSLTVPFPVEAVGVGAEWTATSKLELNGIAAENTMHYRLVDRTSESVVVEVTIAQTAPEQDPSIPNVPAGVKVHLTKLDNEGTGQSVFTPDSLVPVSMHAVVSGVSEMTIEQDGQSSELHQELRMAIELTRG